MEEGRSPRLGRFFDRLRVWRSAAPEPSTAAIVGEVAGARALAEAAMEKASYSLEVARDMSLPARMLALMSWLELHSPPSEPLLSVVLATRDRPELLLRAIRSVLAQRFERWELVVVDDGDTDAVEVTLTGVDDRRIVGPTGRGAASGPPATPGCGGRPGRSFATSTTTTSCTLAGCTRSRTCSPSGTTWTLPTASRSPSTVSRTPWRGRLVALLLAVALVARDAAEGERQRRRCAGPSPRLGGSAVRHDLPTGEDWDLLLRLTADREALAVPALSHAYAMDLAGRMSRDPSHRAGLEEIRRRHAGH